MKRATLVLLAAVVFASGSAYAQQDDGQPDQTPPTPGELKEAIDGLGDRATLLENDMEKLKAIKVSGYIQAEWQHFDQSTNPGGRALYFDARKNLFTIRRGRLKVQHKFIPDMSYVLQADFTERGFAMKDAYLTYNLVSNDELTAQVGLFNRPNYEVELSSSVRESAERAQVTRAFYPDERDLGLMFSYQPPISDDFNPKLQLGIFNGVGVAPEVDPYKDIITRLTFPLPLGSSSPIQADLGASLYYGGIPQLGDSITKWEGDVRKTVANDATGSTAGMGNKMNFNIEGQIYLDLLPFGGTIIKGELMSGKRPTAATSAGASTVGIIKGSAGQDSVVVVKGASASNLAIRNQSGFYAYLVQNIGADLQLVLKYDAFDRNTDLAGTSVKSAGDVNSSVLGFGLNYFIGYIRLTFWYEMPKYATDEVVAGVDDLKDNKTTLRFQYKF